MVLNNAIYIVVALVLIFIAVAVIVSPWSYHPRGSMQVIGREELARQPGIDAYFASFSHLDREARRECNNLETYLAAVVSRPPPHILEKLRMDATAAARLLARNAQDALPKHLLHMTWKVAVLGNNAENSWPHTHGNVVCLPLSHFERDDADRVETLIHELIHVYQRADPIGVRLYLKQRGYDMTRESMPVHVSDGARKNPDLAYVWRRRSDGTTAVTMFATTPADMGRTRLVVFDSTWQEVQHASWTHEHPYEEMAYENAARLVKA